MPFNALLGGGVEGDANAEAERTGANGDAYVGEYKVADSSDMEWLASIL